MKEYVTCADIVVTQVDCSFFFMLTTDYIVVMLTQAV